MKRRRGLVWLEPGGDPEAFPAAEEALDEPPGLVAAGGDLRPERLIAAYRRGLFPWYSPGQPILWWCPDPREVLFPSEFRRSRSLAKRERNAGFEQFDCIAGGETAGIPFAALLADRLGLPMIYVRKAPKGHGRNAQIEGHMPEGARVLVIEDLTTAGGSMFKFIDAIRAKHPNVEVIPLSDLNLDAAALR